VDFGGHMDKFMISDELAFITSKNLSAVTSGETRLAKAFASRPTDGYTSSCTPEDDTPMRL